MPAIRGAGPVLLQPQIVRAKTARDFRTLGSARRGTVAGPDGSAEASAY